MLPSVTSTSKPHARQQDADDMDMNIPRRRPRPPRRLRRQQPIIICDEISQHDHGKEGAEGIVVEGGGSRDDHGGAAVAATSTAACGTTIVPNVLHVVEPTDSAVADGISIHICDACTSTTNAAETEAETEAEAKSTHESTTGTSCTTTSAGATFTSVRAEPPMPSCRATPPKQSCMIVKSFDESIHSLGLSHHRPSGKKKKMHDGRRNTSKCTGTTCTSSTADNSNACNTEDDLSVSFSTIEVREFPIVVGDNPSCPMGPPLSISWEPDCELSIDIEEFEDYRNGQGRNCCKRRTGEDLRLDSEQRKYMALNAGHDHHDIAAAVRQVGKDRRSRRRSIHNNLSKPFYAFDVVKESATRKLKRLVLGQKKDSALYDEYMHRESRRRELADMTILEEEAEEAAAEFPYTSNAAAAAAAIVIEEDSTHRGSQNFYVGDNRSSQGRRANAA